MEEIEVVFLDVDTEQVKVEPGTLIYVISHVRVGEC